MLFEEHNATVVSFFQDNFLYTHSFTVIPVSFLNFLHISSTITNQDMCSTPFILKDQSTFMSKTIIGFKSFNTDQSVSPKWKGYPMQILEVELKICQSFALTPLKL